MLFRLLLTCISWLFVCCPFGRRGGGGGGGAFFICSFLMLLFLFLCVCVLFLTLKYIRQTDRVRNSDIKYQTYNTTMKNYTRHCMWMYTSTPDLPSLLHTHIHTRMHACMHARTHTLVLFSHNTSATQFFFTMHNTDTVDSTIYIHVSRQPAPIKVMLSTNKF